MFFKCVYAQVKCSYNKFYKLRFKKKRRLTAPEKNRDIHLNFMHFNGRNGSVVLHSFKAMIFRLEFSTPHGIAHGIAKGGHRIAIILCSAHHIH